MSFFKDLNVTYWTNTLYNDSDIDINATMEESFNNPLIDVASNYVCAIERMEISGNAIPFYDVDTDISMNTNGQNNVKTTNVDVGDGTSDSVIYTNIYINFGSGAAIDVINAVYVYTVVGKFYSLQDLITYLQLHGDSTSNPNGGVDTYGKFSLGSDGCIIYQLYENFDYYFNYSSCIQFDSPTLASIFGLPLRNTIAHLWFGTYSQFSFDLWPQQFKTKYSRIDAGNIPSTIQLGSNLPFESDQVNTAKTNIATDFALAYSSTNSTSYQFETENQYGYRKNIINGYSWSFNNGGMIIYNPNERRWLNFSAPTPISQIRLSVLYITNDGTSTQVKLPPGCKFSIKIGFYKKEK